MTLIGQIKLAADRRFHRQDWKGFMGDTNAVQGEPNFSSSRYSRTTPPSMSELFILFLSNSNMKM